MRIPHLHHLAVLRAVVEGRDAGEYFGSTLSLLGWVHEALNLGLIDRADVQGPGGLSRAGNLLPTPLGQAIYESLKLDTYPEGWSEWWQSRGLRIESLICAGDTLRIRERGANPLLARFAGCTFEMAEDAPGDTFAVSVVNPATGRRNKVTIHLDDVELLAGWLLEDADAIAARWTQEQQPAVTPPDEAVPQDEPPAPPPRP